VPGPAPTVAGPRPGDLPERALYRPGHLELRYPGEGGGATLAASWSPADASGDVAEPGRAELARAALLEAVAPAAPAADAEPVLRLDAAEWDATMRAVLEVLVPDAQGEGALIDVLGHDVVVHRAPGGAPTLVLHEHKPAQVRVVRTVGPQAFASLASEVLRRRHGTDARLLFDTGTGDGALVFFDLRTGESVLLLREAAGTAEDLGRQVGYALRMSDALLLRAHVVTPLVRPFTTVTRLAWLAVQSVATLPPRAVEPTGEPPPVRTDAVPMDTAAWEARLDELVGTGRYRGAIEPLIDGEAFFGALVQAIQDARESIDLRLYIFDRDDFALRIAELLRRRSHEVRVRVLVDYLGSLTAGQTTGPRVYPYASTAGRDEPSIVELLRRDSRIEVRAAANPWLTGDHAKTIVVDRERAFAGGMNIGHEYRYVWHDMMVGLRGPIVGRLAHDFEQRWAHAGLGGDLAFVAARTGDESFRGPADDPSYATMRPLYTRTGDPQILRAQLAAMRAARSRIWIEQAYVADDAVVAELIRARRRGVDVRIVLPSRGDFGLMDGANLVAANAFVRNGIRVYAFPGMTHVKAALYDGWACVGSANFDKLSLRVNQETNLGTSDPRFVARLERELFERDFARSVPVETERRLGWSAYFASFVAGQL
jgi:cardiolipin synthase